MFQKIVILTIVMASGDVLFPEIVDLHLNVPPVNQLYNVNLWSLNARNTSRETVDVYFYGEITKINTGTVARGNTQRLKLAPNFTYHFTPSDFRVEVGFIDPNLADGLKKKLIPEGSYRFCVYARSHDDNKTLGRDCQTINVLYSRTIQLIYPPDSSETPRSSPLTFSWTPLNLPGQQVIDYTIRIVPVDSGQTPHHAMKRNHPIFVERNIKTTMWTYPLNAPSLVEGQTYAWQIEGYSSISSHKLGESEIWTFTIASRMPDVVDTGFIDTVMLRKLQQTYSESLCVDAPSPCCNDWHTVSSQGSNTYFDANGNGLYDSGADPLISFAGSPSCWAPSPANILTSMPCNAQWVSNHDDGHYGGGSASETYFTVFDIPADKEVCEACLNLSADDSAKVWLNGHFVDTHSGSWFTLSRFNVPSDFFVSGTNILKVEVISPTPYYIGAIYCLHYCLVDTLRRDNVLRVDSVIPGDCGCMCCKTIPNSNCQVRVHVTGTLGRCGAEIDSSSASLILRGAGLTFSLYPTSWSPDNASNTSGWFIFNVPDTLCEYGTQRLCASFTVNDAEGHSLVPESHFDWCFTVDASPPHISMTWPVCVACGDSICNTPDLRYLKFYIDDACPIDSSSLQITIRTSSDDYLTLNVTSPGVDLEPLPPHGGHVLKLSLASIFCDYHSPYLPHPRHFDWIDIVITVCDGPEVCGTAGYESDCHCRTCSWRMCNVNIPCTPIEEDIPGDTLNNSKEQ